jgi:DNA-binding transcriptional ArsR family regulator
MNMDSYRCCVSSTIEGKKIDSLVSILKIVTEPNRLKLLCILQKGERCVCEIMEQINLSQSLISHHLKDLKNIGIIQDEKRGLYVYYSLTDEGKRITKLLFKIEEKIR